MNIMNILWVSNIVLPEAQSLLTGRAVLRGTGGWLIGAANALLKDNSIHLSIASPSADVSDLKFLKGERISYYLFPLGSGNHRYNKEFEPFFKEINALVRPDVVHLHGTEFSHCLAYVRACGSKHVVASIQGMTSVYWAYKTLGIPKWELIRNLSFADIFLEQSLFHKVEDLKRCGECERHLIKELNHVIGRTLWDRSNTWAINPNIKYHFCNETLRPEFYNGVWSYEKCEKHTIFCNQPTNSTKGFHQLLKALPLVIQQFPDTKVYLTGIKTLEPDSFKHRLIEPGYTKYLRKKIKELGLSEHLCFLGSLDAEQMKQQYLNANVFVSCSTIENSPNSIGEAQILGTPCISSYVGGVSDLIEERKSGFLYRFEETDTLAYLICRIFSKDIDFEFISNNEIECAKLRHNQDANSKQLIRIYKEILNDE